MDSLLIIVLMGGLGILTLVGGFVATRRADQALIEERLGIEKKEQKRPAERRTPIGDALEKALERRGIGSNLATQLARADLKWTVGEFMAVTVIAVVASGGIFYFFRRDLLATVIVCIAAFFAPRLYVKMRQRKRLRAFTDQLGDTINLMVNGIRAGYSVLQAMEAVSKEMGPPVSEEFARVVKEVQLGLSLEQAMNNMLRRVPSDDLDMMITAINVQREVGGNLAEVLDAISYTIRERVRIKGELMAKTAQSRLSGYMVGAVPVGLAVILYLLNPSYMGQLFNHVCGYIMLGCAAIGVALGFAAMSKVMQIDV
ncbi:MAG: type II secretion system F family protein [Anaerolineae bacterium]|nr:type II secretion system F family protein [Anaerolineae bacterium]